MSILREEKTTEKIRGFLIYRDERRKPILSSFSRCW